MTLSVSGSQITFADNSTQNTSAYGGGFAFRNRIINGAMVIDQRNAGAASANTINGYFLDRWQVLQSTTGKIIAQQNAGSVTTPAGFTNYLGVTSQSAYTVGSSDYYMFQQCIEGFNTTDLAFGTANASSITLSFRVYSSLTGTFGGVVKNYASTRSYPFTYTISSANTWTTISITIAGDTSGTWAGATNSGSFIINFGLGVGSTYSGTAGSWASANYISATGATSVVGTNGATFYITGVQLEKGSTATSFDYRPYGTELALCQRYYQIVGRGGAGKADATTLAEFSIPFRVEMRASPTATANNTSNNILNSGIAYATTTGINNYSSDTMGAVIHFTSTGLVLGATMITSGTCASLSAEL